MAIETMDVAQMLNVIFSYLVDESMDADMARPEARDAVQQWLDGASEGYNEVPPEVTDRWGLEPDHVAGIERAFVMTGGLPSGE